MPVPRFADVGCPDSLAGRLRSRRRRLLVERVGRYLDGANVLDVGGTAQAWREFEFASRIVIVNLSWPSLTTGRGRFVQGDGLNLPFPDKSFALVVSNSVIEHVGDFAHQQRFADEIRRVGTRYWVQAPNRYFPLEPHMLFPGFQFLPVQLKVRVALYWPFSWPKHYGSSPSELEYEARTIRLPSPAEMRRLFPDATFYRETVGGLTKSIIAHSPG